MGSFAKKLGQLATRSLETESAKILRTTRANKIQGSLAYALDQTLQEGHDMHAFGLGTCASLGSRQRYARFTASMYMVYSTMEEQFDMTSGSSSCCATVWGKYGKILRRAPKLKADLMDVLEDRNCENTKDGEIKSHIYANDNILNVSPATRSYVEGIREAGESDRRRGGGRLLGHLYCRYFADLFGGQMLGEPTRLALSLPLQTPRHYRFQIGELDGPEVEEGKGSVAVHSRGELIESLYEALNDSGRELEDDDFKAVVDEALRAFEFNKAVYTEDSPLLLAAVSGVANVTAGFLRDGFRTSSSKL
eukprot:jgi/Bigna1/130533/aug1.11_g5241